MAKLSANSVLGTRGTGVVMFFVSITTGKSIRVDFPDKDIILQELRLLMRSRHVYILFNSLIHRALGVCLRIRPQTRRKSPQYFGSILLMVSAGLLWAFVTETYQFQHFSDISRVGIYTSLAGAGFHSIGGLTGQRRDR